MTEPDLEAKFLGSMVGSALGDAIGELAFSYPERARLSIAVEGKEVLRYTDDTAMAIGLATSLAQKGSVDGQHLGETFRRNFEREPWRGYASGPPTVFYMADSMRISYYEAAQRLFGGAGSLGNGASMRIAPLGLFFHNSEDLYSQARASAAVTHAHPVGKDGAAVQAFAVAQAVRLDSRAEFSVETFVSELTDFSRSDEIQEKMGLVMTLLSDNASPEAAAAALGQSVAVDESMPFAVFSFLNYPRSFEECLFCSVLHGGDRDTLGAMACAVSGAYLGIDAIPSSWQEKLEDRELIQGLALELANKAG